MNLPGSAEERRTTGSASIFLKKSSNKKTDIYSQNKENS